MCGTHQQAAAGGGEAGDLHLDVGLGQGDGSPGGAEISGPVEALVGAEKHGNGFVFDDAQSADAGLSGAPGQGERAPRLSAVRGAQDTPLVGSEDDFGFRGVAGDGLNMVVADAGAIGGEVPSATAVVTGVYAAGLTVLNRVRVEALTRFGNLENLPVDESLIPGLDGLAAILSAPQS